MSNDSNAQESPTGTGKTLHRTQLQNVKCPQKQLSFQIKTESATRVFFVETMCMDMEVARSRLQFKTFSNCGSIIVTLGDKLHQKDPKRMQKVFVDREFMGIPSFVLLQIG